MHGGRGGAWNPENRPSENRPENPGTLKTKPLKTDPRNSKILTDGPKYANKMEFKSKFDSHSNVKIFSCLDHLPKIDEELWKYSQSLISAQSPPTL